MCAKNDYESCPECAADNVIYRSTCWRCGATLPYSLGLDGRMHRNVPANASRDRTPIEILLDTARNMTFEREAETAQSDHPSPDPPGGR